MFNAVWNYLISETFRNHVENLYWLAGVALVVGVFLAAKQLKLASRQLAQAKESFRLSCVREGYRIAAERCDYFGQHIIPQWQALEAQFKTDGITLLDKSKVTIEGNTIKFDGRELDPAEEPKVNARSPEMSKLLNAIEGWAVFFVARVADEQVGFLTCGHAFVRLFERFVPIYIMAGALDDHNKHAQTLFFTWRERINQEKIIKQTKHLVGQIDVSKLKSQKPIGA